MHYILKIPDDVIPEGKEPECPEFFELQIKTLFQHAWSEAHHDLGYKCPRELSRDEKRLLAFAAAQAWGADKVYADLSESIIFVNDNDQQNCDTPEDQSTKNI